MGRRILKWLGIVLGSLIAILLIAALGIFIASESMLNQKFDVADTAVDLTIPTDSASVERGEYLVSTHFCTDCHGADLGGGIVIDEPNIATLYAPNLTEIADDLTGAEWDLAVRHGIDQDGGALYLMTSRDYQHLTDSDVAAMLAYIRNLPEVDRDTPAATYGAVGRFGLVVGLFPPPDAARIDHTRQRPEIERAPTAEYGEYLAQVCTGCHQPDFSGGLIAGLDYEAANIQGGAGLSGWSATDFITAMRTGVTPDGDTLDPTKMPWPQVALFTDDDLTAIHAYLMTLP